ncbi:MAG: hypothetical protein V4467_03930 [Patescibacteria group bacterium]
MAKIISHGPQTTEHARPNAPESVRAGGEHVARNIKREAKENRELVHAVERKKQKKELVAVQGLLPNEENWESSPARRSRKGNKE